MRWLISSQSLALMASSVTFPFYLLFIKNLGSNYASFGFAYGIFMLSSSVFHVPIGKAADWIGNKPLLLAYSWGMAIVFLFIPLISTYGQVYIVQIFLGFLAALQKTAEKGMVADLSDGKERGREIGKYHFWTSLFSALAVFASGIMVDFFSIHTLFYIASLFYLGSGLLILKLGQQAFSPALKEENLKTGN